MELCLCKNCLVTLLCSSQPPYSPCSRSLSTYSLPFMFFWSSPAVEQLAKTCASLEFESGLCAWQTFCKGAGFGQRWVGDQSGVWQLPQLPQTSACCYWQQPRLRRFQFVQNSPHLLLYSYTAEDRENSQGRGFCTPKPERLPEGCKIPAQGKSQGPRWMYFPMHPNSRLSVARNIVPWAVFPNTLPWEQGVYWRISVAHIIRYHLYSAIDSTAVLKSILPW